MYMPGVMQFKDVAITLSWNLKMVIFASQISLRCYSVKPYKILVDWNGLVFGQNETDIL